MSPFSKQQYRFLQRPLRRDLDSSCWSSSARHSIANTARRLVRLLLNRNGYSNTLHRKRTEKKGSSQRKRKLFPITISYWCYYTTRHNVWYADRHHSLLQGSFDSVDFKTYQNSIQCFSTLGLMPLPNFLPDSQSSILRLSNKASFVSEFYWDGNQNSSNIFLTTCCKISLAHHSTMKIWVF